MENLRKVIYTIQADFSVPHAQAARNKKKITANGQYTVKQRGS